MERKNGVGWLTGRKQGGKEGGIRVERKGKQNGMREQDGKGGRKQGAKKRGRVQGREEGGSMVVWR